MSQFRIVLNFGKPGERKPKRVMFPLASAVLCVDCEVLSDAPGHTCPACGGPGLMSVVQALGGSLAEEVRARQIDMDEEHMSEVVRKLLESVLQ
jgi:hypothetical protein